jgi:hypothetical protein
MSSRRWLGRATAAFFAAARYYAFYDPLARVLGYLEFRKAMLHRNVAILTCYSAVREKRSAGGCHRRSDRTLNSSIRGPRNSKEKYVEKTDDVAPDSA